MPRGTNGRNVLCYVGQLIQYYNIQLCYTSIGRSQMWIKLFVGRIKVFDFTFDRMIDVVTFDVS